MLELFFEPMLIVIIGISGVFIIAILLVIAMFLLLGIYTGIEFLLWKLRLVKEPGWHKRERELKIFKASIP